MKSSYTKFAAALVLLAIYAFIVLHGSQGIPGLMEKQRQIRDYEKANADKVRQIEEQRARIGRITDSPEMQIRERLKLLKPGEKAFILQDPPPAAAPPKPHQ